MSRGVFNDEIAHLGPQHYGRKQHQPAPEAVRAFYVRAVDVTQYPPMKFDAAQIDLIGKAFGETIREHRYTCYACAIMPEHVHLVIRKHRDKGEAMIEHFQRASALRLYDSGTVDINHPVWTHGGWTGFLDSPHRIRAAIRYVERNPVNDGLPPQRWPFVSEYDGWPFHRKG